MNKTLDEFEEAWRTGDSPRIEDWLNPAVTDQAKGKSLSELLEIELWWRVKAGEHPVPAEYELRFPGFSDAIKSALEEFDRSSVNSHAYEETQIGIVEADNALRDAADQATLLPNEDSATSPLKPDSLEGSTRVGETLKYFGEYELLDEIARGGMGVVYKAKQRGLNRVVALKMILAGQLAGPDDVARFKTEAEAAAQLDHWGIVPIYEIGEHENQHYFSMAFVEGESLQDKLRQGPLEPREAAELCAKIAEAIAYAHEKGVIHRDLKPANILLDCDGTPKVTDFGLAKQIQSDSGLTQTGSVMGTPSYMPPEQASGDTSKVGPLADVYSLGAILYCLLTGRPPFQAASPLDTLMQVLEQEPIPPRDLNPQANADLETITLKCLEKKSERRYESAAELHADLQRFLNDEPIQAQPPTFGYRFRKAFKKYRVVFLTTAAIAALLIAGLAGTGTMWFRASAAETDARTAESEARLSESKARISEGTAKLRLSRSNFFLATSRFTEGRVLDAHRFLTSIPAEHRDIEWYLAKEQMKGGDLTYFEHEEPVGEVEYSPDGRYVASAGTSIHLWDPVTGKKLRSLNPDAGRIFDVAFSPDGKLLAVAHQRYIGLWNLEAGKLVRKLIGHSKAISSIDFSHDGKFLVSGSVDTLVVVWNVRNGRSKIMRGHGNGSSLGSVNFVRFLSNGHVLSSSFDGTIRQWDPGTQKQFSIQRFGSLDCHADLGPAESKLVANAGGVLRLVQIDGTRLWEMPSQCKGRPVFSPDGSIIAIRPPDNSLAILDAASGLELHRLRGHWKRITSISFSPDSRRIATASTDGSVKIWSLDTPFGRNVNLAGPVRFGPENELVSWRKVEDCYSGESVFENNDAGYSNNDLAISSNGQLLASGGGHQDSRLRLIDRADGVVHVVDVHSNKPLLRVVWPGPEDIFKEPQPDDPAGAEDSTEHEQYELPRFDLSPNGRFLVTGDPGDDAPQLRLLRIDADAPSLEWSISAHEGVHEARFSPDGKSIATAGINGPIRVWRTSDGKQVEVLEGTSRISKILFSPDGKLLLCCTEGSVRIWKTSNFELVHELRGVGGHDLAISSTGRRILSIDGPMGTKVARTFRVWDVATGEELSSSATFHKKIQLHPNGESILLGNDTLWNAPIKSEFTVLVGHRDSVTQAGFSEDGTRVYSESVDQRLVWDTQTGSVIEDAKWEDPKELSSRSPDGNSLVHWIDSVILLVDLTYGESSDVASLRKFKASPKASWHAQKALEADERKEYFPCEFHASRALLREPDSTNLYQLLVQSTLKVTEKEIARLSHEEAKSSIDKLEKSAAARINNETWEKVLPSEARPSSKELELISAAVRDFPNAATIRTLGVAEYRFGNYLAAMCACLKSGTTKTAPNENTGQTSLEIVGLFQPPASPSAIDVAIISMSNLRLGNHVEAAAFRSRLDKMMKQPPYKSDSECLQFLAEVNKLFEDRP